MHPSLRSLGLNVVKSAGNEEYLLCPFHADSKPSASYNRAKGLFYCYVCSLGMNYTQVANRLGVEIELEGESPNNVEDYNLVKESEPLHLGESDYNPYFAVRGITPHTIQRYEVRWKYLMPQAAVMPITNLRGEVIGVQYRFLKPEEAGARYKKHGEMTPVWPMHHLKGLEEGADVFVTEGAWSAMRLYDWFLENRVTPIPCVALFGAKANNEIVNVLRPFTPHFLYDSDEAGTRACRRMRKLWPGANVWTLSKSPDDMEMEEISRIHVRMIEVNEGSSM